MIEINNIYAHYGRIEALSGVSLAVNAGEIVTLIGANGAGKSTLLMSICADPAPSSGSIRLFGDEISQMPTHEIMRRGIAIAPEGRRIFPGLSVLENLQLGAFFADPSQIEVDLQRIFNLFPILSKRSQQRGGTLSGGEQQMLAIGRALMARPKLLLLDEPSLGLAPLVIAQIFAVIEEIRQEGITIFLVEQNAHRALQIADRGYVLESGRMVLEDSGVALLENPEVKRAYLGGY